MRVLLINGPNLNTLGRREPHIYGHDTLDDIVERVTELATDLGAEIESFQSNHEGAIIDFIQANQESAHGMVINPGALGHSSIAIRDAIVASELITVEVHISNVHAREEFRKETVLTPACKGMITGLGWRGYLFALTAVVEAAKEEGLE
ncbi:MAG TPA: type II 3-dehydroquinate dehydratase [Dehalococcoidia bacterium]|nr:type II 3-dehydroquinate dehydratase [Dehalococcoidia bacterium]